MHKPPAVVPSSRSPLVDELAAFDRLLEIGVGERPEVARALARRGCDVVAIDVDSAAVDDREPVPNGDAAEFGSLRFRRGDVVALAETADPLGALANGAGPPIDGIDAVYGLNLPAELQRPAVELAERLGAACLFTTLGFEEPVVPVKRRPLGAETLYVARDPTEPGPGP